MNKVALVGLGILFTAAAAISAQSAHAEPPTVTTDPKLGFIDLFKDKDWIARLRNKSQTRADPVSVKLRDELNTLFETNFCQIDKAFLKKFKKAQAGQTDTVETAIPAEVYKAIGARALDLKVTKIDDKAAAASLHLVFVAGEDGKSRGISIEGAETYSKDIAMFLDTQQGDFAFTTDCSGYVNTAIDAGASMPTATAEVAVKAALSKKFSTLVMRAHVYSPGAAAMAPKTVNLVLDRGARMDILYAIVAAIDDDSRTNGKTIDEKMVITAYRKVDLMWASNDGQSTYTGSIDLKASARAGVGIATFSGQAGSGIALGRQVKFNNMSVFVLPTDAGTQSDGVVSRPFKDVKEELISGYSNIKPTAVRTVDNSKVEMLVPDVKPKACGADWTVSIASVSEPGSVTTSTTSDGCVFTFAAAASIAEKTNVTFSTRVVSSPEVKISFSILAPKITL